MDEPRADLFCLIGKHSRRQRIDRTRQFRLSLRLVHRRVGRRIDDNVRRNAAHCIRKLRQIGEIATKTGLVAMPQRDDLSQRRQAALQLPAHLAIPAEQKDLHQRRSA
jgi:hypothetical protein